MSTDAVIYARFSTDKQDARSLDDQIRRCVEFATRAGLNVIDTYADPAISGATVERPHLQRLLADVKSSKGRAFSAVLVDDVSRLSRDLFQMGEVVFSQLASYRVRVIDCMTGTASDSTAGRQVFTAMGNAADLFLQMVKAETHRGLDGRALAGFWTGGRVYGYSTVPEPNPSDPEHPRKTLVVNDKEAAIVRMIFDLYCKGRGFASIADLLNRDGIAAPYDGASYKKKRGQGWQASSIRNILTNERYIGRWVWNKRQFLRVAGKKSRSSVKRPEREWRKAERPELAIVSLDQWGLVEKKMAKRAGRPLGSGSQKEKRVHLLSGTALCGVCGRGLGIIGQRTKKGVRYVTFGCTARHTRGKSACSNTATISELKLNTLIIDHLKTRLFRPGAIKLFVEEFNKAVKAERKTPKGDGFATEIAAAKKGIANLTDALKKTGYSEAVAAALKTEEERLKLLTARSAEKAGGATKAPPIPTERAVRAYLTGLFRALDKDPEYGKTLLRSHFKDDPPKLVPESEGPDRFYRATGAFQVFVPEVLGNQSCGGRI